MNCVAENGVYKIRPMRVLLAKDNDAVTWHRKLGHLNYGTMCDMKTAGIIDFEDDDVEVLSCEVCARGKRERTAVSIRFQ